VEGDHSKNKMTGSDRSPLRSGWTDTARAVRPRLAQSQATLQSSHFSHSDPLVRNQPEETLNRAREQHSKAKGIKHKREMRMGDKEEIYASPRDLAHHPDGNSRIQINQPCYRTVAFKEAEGFSCGTAEFFSRARNPRGSAT